MPGGLTTELRRPARSEIAVEQRPLDDPAWAAFVDAHPDATPFHHPSWASVLAAAYHYPAFALVALDSRGEPVGGTPALECRNLRGRRRWVALPFTDALDPLLAPGLAAGTLAVLLDRLREAAHVTSIEVRAELASPSVRDEPRAVVHTLELEPDADGVLAGFRHSQARNVRKAERSGVEVVRGSSRRDLATVYYDLHVRTRRRQGVPPQPRRFFELLWDHVLAPGLGFVLLAYAGATPIAGAVFLASGSVVVYKYGASLPEFWHLSANSLLLSRAIEWGCAGGFRRFDFGRTDQANAGLRAFKSSFGAAERPLVYSTLGSRGRAGSGTSTPANAASAVLRIAPLAVCRGIGAFLYRYAA